MLLQLLQMYVSQCQLLLAILLLPVYLHFLLLLPRFLKLHHFRQAVHRLYQGFFLLGVPIFGMILKLEEQLRQIFLFI